MKLSLPILILSYALCMASGALADSSCSTAEVTLQSIPRLASAREQLDYAREMKRSLRGLKGERREQVRKDVVEAYRAVRRNFPRELALSSEASFRAAEMLRSGRQIDLALAEFEHAVTLGASTEFRPRAGLEIGHILRHRKQLNCALENYEAVEAMPAVYAAERELAAFWSGRVHLTLDRPIDASRCFKRAATSGVDPVQRTRSFDAWCGVLLDKKDLEGAAGVLELCRKALSEFAAEKTQLGTRVRGALEVMKAPERLKRDIEARAKKDLVTPPPARFGRRLRSSSRWRNR
ncbi:MAG: tetratricopeptide (TPR) repeat protein [Planctomycetota bacterium]|jgi:tetratricopeptide (TPR) repeat protein